MNAEKVRVLMVDDDEDEFVIARDLLHEADRTAYAIAWADTFEKGLAQIGQKAHDVYLVDYRLGARTGIDLLQVAVKVGCTAPIILLTGQGDRAVDMEAMKAGAADYLDKNSLTTQLLERSIRYAVEKQKLINSLQDALEKIKTLKGLVPICAHCKKIRDDSGYWSQMEIYIEQHSEAEFSHGLCPDCMKKHYGVDPDDLASHKEESHE